MDFTLSAEQCQFRDAVRGFADRHLAADARKRAHSSDYPHDVAKLMAAQGLFGIAMSEDAGGQGGALMDSIYSEDSLVEYCFRRTRGWMIAGGSVEI